MRKIVLTKFLNGIFGFLKSSTVNLGKTGILALILYQTVLAVLYGGYPCSMYPDEWWMIATGFYLTDAGNSVAQTIAKYLSDKAIMLPVFEGVTYKALGFPAFLYMLCSWNIATMCILLVSTYYIGKHYFDEKTGLLATFLVGLNWHVIWFGQRLLGDIGMVAFEFASVAFFLKYIKSRNWVYLLASGLGGALAIWTREAALYLYPPLLLMLIDWSKYKNKAEWAKDVFYRSESVMPSNACYVLKVLGKLKFSYEFAHAYSVEVTSNFFCTE